MCIHDHDLFEQIRHRIHTNVLQIFTHPSPILIYERMTLFTEVFVLIRPPTCTYVTCMPRGHSTGLVCKMLSDRQSIKYLLNRYENMCKVRIVKSIVSLKNRVQLVEKKCNDIINVPVDKNT